MTTAMRQIVRAFAHGAGLRWGLSLLCVLVLHGAIGAVILRQPPLAEPEEAPAGGMFIELALLPTAPDQAQVEVPPTLAANQTQEPQPPTEPVAETEPPPAPEPVAEREVEPQPEPQPEPMADPPPPAPTAEADLPADMPPAPVMRPVRLPKERAITDKKSPESKRRHAAPATPASPVAAAARAKGRVAAPETSGARAVETRRAVSAWQRQVMRRLARHKRFPRLAKSRRESGVARIRFVMDSRGHVQSVHLVRGTGFALLDKEALALPRRASPLPAPPKNIKRRRIELVVPVRFSIR